MVGPGIVAWRKADPVVPVDRHADAFGAGYVRRRAGNEQRALWRLPSHLFTQFQDAVRRTPSGQRALVVAFVYTDGAPDPPHGPWYDVRWDALLAHETQVDPTSPFWFGLPRDVSRTVHPFDDYVLARSRVDTDLPESDLFAGLR